MGNAIRHISPARKIIPGRSSELNVIIPCAGVGKRLRSKNAKCLTTLNNETIIERQLHMIWSVYPKSDIFVVVGYQAEEIRRHLKDYPVRFIYNPLFDTTNVSFSIGLALNACISDSMLLIYGDLVFNEDSISLMTIGKSKLLLDSNDLFKNDEIGLVTDENNYVSNLSYGLKRKWAQIGYFKDNELDLLREVCYNDDMSRWFGYEAINNTINMGAKFEALSVPSAKICDVDLQQDLEKALTIR